MKQHNFYGNQHIKKLIYNRIHPFIYLALIALVLEVFLGHEYHNWDMSHYVAPCDDFCNGMVAHAAEPQDFPVQTVKILTHQEIVDNSRHPREINAIWMKESSKGKNDVKGGLQDYCEQKGMSNQFGYSGMQGKMCFKTFEESVSVVDKWLDTRTAENLCYYNLGLKTSNCDYAKIAGQSGEAK